jgi:autotransporter translocation and assembly factor TamB
LNSAKVVNNLDISGNTNMTGTLTTGSLATMNSAKIVNNLDVSGNTNMTGTLSTSSLATMNSGRVVNNLDVSGNTNMTGTLDVNGNLAIRTVNSLLMQLMVMYQQLEQWILLVLLAFHLWMLVVQLLLMVH